MSSQKHVQKSKENPNVFYYDGAFVRKFVRGCVIAGGTASLLLPMILLATIGRKPKLKLGIISGFITLFSAVLGIATRAKNWEVLAAVAA